MSNALRRYYSGHNLVTMRDVQANASRHYHFDHQGTTQCLTDSSGTATERFSSDAWGVEVRRSAPSINTNWYVGDAGYYHRICRLTYVRERYLESPRAAWVSRDPRSYHPAFYDRQASGSVRPCAHLVVWSGGRGAGRHTAFHSSALSSRRDSYDGSWNEKYLYSSNSPALLVDPSGLGVARSGDCPASKRGRCPCKSLPEKSCEEVCASAESTIGKGKGGTIVCGSGRMCHGVWGDPKGACPTVDDCTSVHEQVHCTQSYCPDQCTAQPRQGFFSPTEDPERAECQAYQAQFDCIVAALPKLTGVCVDYAYTWLAVIDGKLLDCRVVGH